MVEGFKVSNDNTENIFSIIKFYKINIKEIVKKLANKCNKKCFKRVYEFIYINEKS